MKEDAVLAYLRELVKRANRLDRPAIELMRPEIRTGDKFLLRDPFAGQAAATAGPRANKRLTKGAVGAIVVEWGYDVPESQLAGFLAFLEANEEALLDPPAPKPKGVKYRGTYSVFSTSEKGSGSFRTIWTYKDFADLDGLSDEYELGTPFASLVKLLKSFVDNRPEAARSQQIYLLANSSKLTGI